MSLNTLPNEMLLNIFKYCDMKELIQLNCVCKRFHDITCKLLNEKANDLLITGQISEKFRERCQPLLSSYTSKFPIHYNWKYGKCIKRRLMKEDLSKSSGTYIFFDEDKCWQRLQMTKNTIWLCDMHTYLCAFIRTKNGSVSFDRVVEKFGSPILNIVSCNDDIVTNHRDGSIKRWILNEASYGGKFFKVELLKEPSPKYDIVMDVTSEHIVSSSDKGEIKIRKYIGKEITQECILQFSKLPFFNSIAFDPTGTKFAAGFEYDNSSNYIIYDINKCCIIDNNKGGIYDWLHFNQLLWADPNTILLRGWTKIEKMDVRTHKVVHTWITPLDSQSDRYVLTCMSSDHQYAIMTGTTNDVVILWDQRQSSFIHTYAVPNPDDYKKGVYSVQFDSSHMYILADKVHEFDFTHTAQNIANIS